MKRIFSMLMAAGLMLGSAVSASAVDFRAAGNFEFGFEYARNLYNIRWGHVPDSGEDSFEAMQRFTFRLDAIANEKLRGVYVGRAGDDIFWGNQDTGIGRNSGGGIGSQGVNLNTREAYIDWKPTGQSNIRMGMQGVVLPNAVAGSPVMDTRVAGVTATYAFTNEVAASLFWYRPSSSTNGVITNSENRFSKWDMFGLVLPLTFDGVSVTPWGLYSQMGRNATNLDMFAAPGNIAGPYYLGNDKWADPRAGQKIRPWWVGLAAEISLLDPLIFKMDAIYSGAKGSGNWSRVSPHDHWTSAFNNSFENDYSSRGWLLIAKLQYKLDSMTPGLIGWYGSGDKIENGKRKLRRLNIIEPSFQATSFGFDGSYSLTKRSCNIGVSPEGTWAVGLLAEEIHFLENIEHNVRLLYYRGTNAYSKNRNYGGNGLVDSAVGFEYGAKNGQSLKPGNCGLYLTRKDWAMEVNVDTVYTIMDHLNVAVELGYMYVDVKNASQYYPDNSFARNAYKLGMYFVYDF